VLRLIHCRYDLILSRVVQGDRGVAAVFTALAAAMLMGFAGLAVDAAKHAGRG
jgi:Flp pilus assembly protein TadG